MLIVCSGQTTNPKADGSTMGFGHLPQWRRHKATLAITMPTRIVCERCQVELPVSIVPGQVVLSKEDRLYIGDDFKAVDCVL